nr:GNAT family N-acetyltransferase [Nereida sp. MMG025]
MMDVRVAQADDIARVDALLARAYPRLLKADYAPSVMVTALPIISRARPELVSCGTFYVVEKGDQLFGAGGWTRRGDPAGFAGGDATVGDIRHVVTDDRHVRRGVGRALMGHILAQARAGGVRRMMCWSTLTAVPFYTAMGFDVLGPKDVTLKGGVVFPSVEMQQML